MRKNLIYFATRLRCQIKPTRVLSLQISAFRRWVKSPKYKHLVPNNTSRVGVPFLRRWLRHVVNGYDWILARVRNCQDNPLRVFELILDRNQFCIVNNDWGFGYWCRDSFRHFFVWLHGFLGKLVQLGGAISEVAVIFHHRTKENQDFIVAKVAF